MVLVLQGDDANPLTVSSASVVLGRQHCNSLLCSQQQLQLSWKDDSWYVTQLVNCRNPSRLLRAGGQHVPLESGDPVVVKTGDSIFLINFKFRFQVTISDPPAVLDPAPSQSSPSKKKSKQQTLFGLLGKSPKKEGGAAPTLGASFAKKRPAPTPTEPAVSAKFPKIEPNNAGMDDGIGDPAQDSSQVIATGRHKGESGQDRIGTNVEISRVFEELADLYKVSEIRVTHWSSYTNSLPPPPSYCLLPAAPTPCPQCMSDTTRQRTYSKAAGSIKSFPRPITVAELPALRKVKGIGEAIQKKVLMRRLSDCPPCGDPWNLEPGTWNLHCTRTALTALAAHCRSRSSLSPAPSASATS
jgi:hypothetical protein